jgi:methanogenic corrinoid protein MtbC1
LENREKTTMRVVVDNRWDQTTVTDGGFVGASTAGKERGRGAGAGTGGKLSIGALSRATGIPVDTLRTWERRYGYPIPERKPSGHRVYSVSSIPRLRRIAEALVCGHRAGDVVSASEEDLGALVRATNRRPGSAEQRPVGTVANEDLLRAIRDFDAEHLMTALRSEWGRLGPLEFLRSRLAPLIQAVGDQWEAGALGVRHEHFVSERIGDLLRGFRLPIEELASGPLVILATLEGEIHGLGLQMAALTLSSAGCRTLYLGTEMPVDDLARLARDINARAVAVSMSIATKGSASARQLDLLRTKLPKRVALLVGGAGAPRAVAGLTTFDDLATLHAWGRQVVAT